MKMKNFWLKIIELKYFFIGLLYFILGMMCIHDCSMFGSQDSDTGRIYSTKVAIDSGCDGGAAGMGIAAGACFIASAMMWRKGPYSP